MAEENLYKWTDNCCVSGVAKCDTDVLNDCLMHLKYENGGGLDGKMTNCLLEAPQNIKLELTDGVLTLKAGSKVIVPNGKNTDGSNKFDEIIIENDITRGSFGSSSNQCFVMLQYSNGKITSFSYAYFNVTSSGTTPPASGNFYNTSTNYLNSYDASAIVDQCAFPVGIMTLNAGVPASIDQVFNGAGVIGSTAWVDKGGKVLISDGRNTDGSLKNIEKTLEKVCVFSTTSAIANGVVVLTLNSINAGTGYLVDYNTYTFGEEEPTTARWYKPSANMFYLKRDGVWIEDKQVHIGDFSKTTTSFTSFQPKLPFRAVDYNDLTAWVNNNKSTIASLSSPDWSKKESKILDTTYTANKNGFILFTSDYSGGAAGGASLKINGEEVIYDYHGLDADDCHCYAPVAKNDTYNITCAHPAKYYYFVPCKEV